MPYYGLHDQSHLVALSRNRMYINLMNLETDDWTKETLRKEELNDNEIASILRAKQERTQPESKDVSDKAVGLKAL
ncbi:hypothetical protein NQ317_007670 [Molorchus minor]|uniref:Uncharacterized protein n=1 Tax=Molorchus minor TaxID=1323400 RepID=A0ABQ9J1C4_9CUCU|nr:hypothetical protein NQ317_007670 [Molorchus minor]